jgi:hypothetical protein
MSLKAFHVVFIIVCTCLTLFCGIWGIRGYRAEGDLMHLLMAVGSLAGGVFLLWYFRWFLRKLKDVSYL